MSSQYGSKGTTYPAIDAGDAIHQFREAASKRGLRLPSNVMGDGRWHRCPVEGGKPGARDGSYKLHLDGSPIGFIQNFRDEIGCETWRAKLARPLSPAEKRAHAERTKRARAMSEAELEKNQQTAASTAAQIWEAASPAPAGHPYLVMKGVGVHGLKLHSDGRLLLPLRDENGTLHSIQFIAGNSDKENLHRGRKKGCFHVLGELAACGIILIAEGFATAASIHEATGLTVVTALDWGNMRHVGEALSRKFPALHFFFCADDDVRQRGNPGLAGAQKAAQAVGGKVIFPVFSGPRLDGQTDFNDLFTSEGAEAVRRIIEGELLNHADEERKRASVDEERERAFLVKEREERRKKTYFNPYGFDEFGIYITKTDGDGNEYLIRLSNFSAQIISEAIHDDGLEENRIYQIKASLEDRHVIFTVPASQFERLDWVAKNLGARAYFEAGASVKSQMRLAIQRLSHNITERRVYMHTGWRKIDGQWAYLHAGGAIGELGALQNIEVSLNGKLGNYLLPEPPVSPALADAVRGSLSLLDLTVDRVSVAMLASVYRVPLGTSDFTLFFTGQTGSLKSETAALAQAHFGSGWHGKNLPGNWSSSANNLESVAYLLKDALFVIDDFNPRGTATQVAAWHEKADRVLRAQGNNTGRGRCNADGTPRVEKAPRGTIICTGEEVPSGHSLRARLFIVEMMKGQLDLDRLTLAQGLAAQGVFEPRCQAM